MNTIKNLLSELGKDLIAREEIVSALVSYEQRIREVDPEANPRLITGEIVDSLFAESQHCEKRLKDGTIFTFKYYPWIARDFILANPRETDHVWEPQTTRILSYFAEKSRSCLIGGAHFGDHAVIIAQKIKNKCFAFEPNDEQRFYLSKNAELNGLKNIVPELYALWSENDKSLVFSGVDALASVVISDHQVEGGLITRTIDSYCSDKSITDIDLIMLDIEGSELQALLGAKGVLEKNSPVVIFEIHSEYVDWSNGLASTDIVKFLSDYGYSCYPIRDIHSNYDMSSYPVEVVDINQVFLDGPKHGFNMLALPRHIQIEDIPFNVVKNVSPKIIWHKDAKYHHPIT